MAEAATGCGYIIKRQKDFEDRVQYIDRLLHPFNADTRHFFKHVLVSGLTPRRLFDGGWVPVYSKLIIARLRKADAKALRDAGLLVTKPYDTRAGRCYEYRVAYDVVERYVEMAPATVEGYVRQKKVDLFTGKPTERIERSEHYDDNRKPHPQLIRTAMNTIEWSYFDAEAVERHLARLKANYERIKAACPSKSVAYKRARGEYLNDKHCFIAVMNQNPEHIGGGIYRYRPAYRVQMSGRISEAGGGLQSCSREMKQAARGRIENMRNYDLRGSQPNGLIQLFEEAGIDTSWLRAYVSNPRAKYAYADAVGLSVDEWKRILCAVFMGANLPKNVRRSNGAVQKTLCEAVGWRWADQQSILDKVVDVIGELKDRIDEWHVYLRTTFIAENVKVCRGGRYVENAAGMRFYVDRVTGNWALGAQLAAFLLQGQEAAFVHQLTALAPKFGFEVIANEHDGLIVIGEIPQEAVKIAAAQSGLHGAVFEEKPLC